MRTWQASSRPQAVDGLCESVGQGIYRTIDYDAVQYIGLKVLRSRQVR